MSPTGETEIRHPQRNRGLHTDAVNRIEVRCWAWPEETGVDVPEPGAPVASGGRGHQLVGYLRPDEGPLDPVVAEVDGPADTMRPVSRGVPAGPAGAEAIVARLRRDGADLVWGEPVAIRSLAHLDAVSRARGAVSPAIVREDPGLLPWLQVGSWFNAGWRVRAMRRALLTAPPMRRALRAPGRSPAGLWRLRADAAFWAGVRRASSAAQWSRLTRSSYVVLNYHRLAGEAKPGQRQLDTSPARFHRQMRLLDRLGFRPMGSDEVEHFHRRADATLDSRRYVITFDDGYRDNAAPLEAHVANHPLLFVPTTALGSTAHWLDGEPVLSWDEVRRLEAAGVEIGSHTRTHPHLPELGPERLADEVGGSRQDLAANLAHPVDVIAYPYGEHDGAARRTAADAGYVLGYTTKPGRNGAGTHPLCLRRIGVWADDGPLRFVWKIVTAEHAPGQAR